MIEDKIQLKGDFDSISGSETIQGTSKAKGSLTKVTIFCFLVTAIGTFQLGWNAGVFNIPEKVIEEFYNDTYVYHYGEPIPKNSLVVLWALTNSLLPAGGLIGGLTSGFFADNFGRKRGMIYVNFIVFFVGILNAISKPAKTYITLMMARFISGIFCGLFSGIAPMYLSEIPPKNWRGFSGVIFQLSIVIGLLTANIFGLPQLLGTSTRWPYLASLTIIPGILFAIGAFLPYYVESPKYICQKHANFQEAEASLKKLRGAENSALIQQELNEMIAEKSNEAQTISYRDLFTNKSLYRPLIVTIVIQMSQQLSGINAVVFYSTNIFNKVGIDGLAAVYATIGLSLIQVIMTFVSMVLIDRAGRRLLLLIGLIGMTVSMFSLALSGVLSQSIDNFKYLSIISTVAFIILFSVGPGCIPWLITAELFNSNARGKAGSIAVFVNWLSNFIVTLTFPFLEEAIGNYSFLIFGSLLAMFSVYSYLKVPETKGKTTEEIMLFFADERLSFATRKEETLN